jgi:hypothetical protein
MVRRSAATAAVLSIISLAPRVVVDHAVQAAEAARLRPASNPLMER